MPEVTVNVFQTRLAARYRALMPDIPVRTEWAAMQDENGLYSPRLDIAVGPFATGDLVLSSEYDALADQNIALVEALHAVCIANIAQYTEDSPGADLGDVLYRNQNARCFIGIEIENNVSRKHLMGGAINAAALGRIGLVIAWTEEKLRALIRLRSYLLFLANVGKNTFDPMNLLILSADQVEEVLDLEPYPEH